MKMSIAEAIETLLYARSYGTAHIAKSVAINTMRKYQKITKIIEHWINEDSVGMSDYWIGRIKEVIEEREQNNE